MERYELEESREYKVAMVLEDALNNTCFDYKMFAESVCLLYTSDAADE